MPENIHPSILIVPAVPLRSFTSVFAFLFIFSGGHLKEMLTAEDEGCLTSFSRSMKNPKGTDSAGTDAEP